MDIHDEQIGIDLFKDKMKLKGRQSTLPTSEGLVWTQLVSNVSTPYIFAAIDVLYVDPIDVNMIRMVRITYHVCIYITFVKINLAVLTYSGIKHVFLDKCLGNYER